MIISAVSANVIGSYYYYVAIHALIFFRQSLSNRCDV